MRWKPGPLSSGPYIRRISIANLYRFHDDLFLYFTVCYFGFIQCILTIAAPVIKKEAPLCRSYPGIHTKLIHFVRKRLKRKSIEIHLGPEPVFQGLSGHARKISRGASKRPDPLRIEFEARTAPCELTCLPRQENQQPGRGSKSIFSLSTATA